MPRYFKLAFEGSLTAEQAEKVRRWCGGHMFLDARFVETSNPPVMYFTTPNPRAIREVNSSIKMNFRNWGIQFTPYKRGTLTQVPLEEYAEHHVSDDLQDLVFDTVQSILAKARANVKARDDKIEALTKRHALLPCFRALAKNAKDSREARRQLKIRLQRLEQALQKPLNRMARVGFTQLKDNARAAKAKDTKDRNEKIKSLYQEFASISGLRVAIQWPADLSNVHSVYDVPELARFLPRQSAQEDDLP
jgi:hypothetical protein